MIMHKFGQVLADSGPNARHEGTLSQVTIVRGAAAFDTSVLGEPSSLTSS